MLLGPHRKALPVLPPLLRPPRLLPPQASSLLLRNPRLLRVHRLHLLLWVEVRPLPPR